MSGTAGRPEDSGTENGRKAAACGSLSERPVPRLLHQLFRHRITGVLILQDESQDETRVFLRDGVPVHARRPDDLDHLHRVIADAALIPATALSAAMARVGEGGRLGDLLVGEGVLTQAQLGELLKQQLRRKLLRLFFVRRGRFDVFLEEHPYGKDSEFKAMRLDPRALLVPGIRAAYDDARLREELAPLTAHTFKLIQLPPGLADAMGIPASDATLKQLSLATTLAELPASGPKSLEARSLVLALLYADFLETAKASEAPTQVAPPVAQGDPVLRNRIESLGARLDQLSHFELLELPETAKPDEISAAYLRLLRQLHPDRLANARDLIPTAERISARLGQAQATLMDPKARAAYVASRSGTPQIDAAEAIRGIMGAEDLFAKGQAFEQRSDFARAAEAYADAMKKNPMEPAYRAHWAWARFEAAVAEARADRAREGIRIVDQVLKERPRFPQGFYWKGQFHKTVGEMPAAEKAFREAVSQNPNLLEAAREIRLIEMRRVRTSSDKLPLQGKASASSTALPQSATRSAGFLDRLLKRD